MKRRGRGTYAVDKPPILGVVQREGFVRLIPIADAAARTVLRHLFKNSRSADIEALYTVDSHPTTFWTASPLMKP